MRIAYINHSRFPTEKAHGFQIAQVCDALMELGHEVTMLCPSFQNSITEDPKKYYSLHHSLNVKYVPHFDAFRSRWIPGILGFAVSMSFYGKEFKKQISKNHFDLLYIRSPLLLSSALRTKIPVVIELHSLPRIGRGHFVTQCNQSALVVCLTTPMRDALVQRGVDSQKIIVEADGVDPHRFQNLPDIQAAKQKWKLPMDRPVVGYVGSLVTRETLEKGVRELIDTLVLFKKNRHVPQNLHDLSPFLWIVGGPPRWVETYRGYALSLSLTHEEVRFEDRIDSSRVPGAIAACDICVYPSPKTQHPYFIRDTSPLKLFEYLAAGRPVVCADLPPIRDVVDESSVQFFRPGDPVSLARAVQEVIQHPDEAALRARKGKTVTKEHSWTKRMERILDSFSVTV